MGYFSALPGALPWLLLVLLAAWVGQLIGDQLFSAEVGGFVGAAVMTPIALVIARFPGGPPSLVTPIGSIVAIALGVLAGASLFRGLVAAHSSR